MRAAALPLLLLPALVGATAAAQPSPADEATARGWRRVEREADAMQRRSPQSNPGDPAYYRGSPWMAQWTLRQCARGLPGGTPSPAACRAARLAAEGR